MSAEGTRQPVYLGDGAYAEQGHWAGQVRVYTSDGITPTNEVYLEVDMIDMLHAWAHNQYRNERP